jgi:hypothetical protein
MIWLREERMPGKKAIATVNNLLPFSSVKVFSPPGVEASAIHTPSLG